MCSGKDQLSSLGGSMDLTQEPSEGLQFDVAKSGLHEIFKLDKAYPHQCTYMVEAGGKQYVSMCRPVT